jgi:hypothetical protein
VVRSLSAAAAAENLLRPPPNDDKTLREREIKWHPRKIDNLTVGLDILFLD